MIWNWFKTHKALRKENTYLQQALTQAAHLSESIYTTLEHTANQLQSLRYQSVSLLGAIALQYNGDIIVKDEFLNMIIDPEQTLEVIIERNNEQHGLLIRVVEKKKDAK